MFLIQSGIGPQQGLCIVKKIQFILKSTDFVYLGIANFEIYLIFFVFKLDEWNGSPDEVLNSSGNPVSVNDTTDNLIGNIYDEMINI